MKRIFILNDKATGGGAEVVMRNVADYLRDKYQVTIMTLDDDYESFEKNFPPDIKYIPSKLKENPYRRINPLYYGVQLYNYLRLSYIRSRKYDVVIANKEGPCMKIVSRMNAGKKLAGVHVDYQYLYWTHWTFTAEEEVQCMKLFDHVICVSKAALNSVKNVIGDPGNLCVKYNPVDYFNIQKKTEESAAVERDETRPLFVAVGRITEQKNFITLAKVCARLYKEFDFNVWLVGDGDQRDAVEQILRENNCECVKILGMQSNPYKYMTKADFLVSSAVWESYGLVVQEALILGIPVLATRCPAIEECFDTKFGMLVDCDEESIEKGMRYILENPECIAMYKKRIAAEYDKESLWEHRLQEIESLI